MSGQNSMIDMRSVVKALLAFRGTFLLVMFMSAAVLTVFYNDPWAAPTLRIFWAGIIFTTIGVLVLRFGRQEWHRAHAWVQVVWDCATTTYLVYETGGVNSGLVLLYAITILLSTILLLSRGAIVSAILSSIGFVGVSLSTSGWALFSDPQLLSRILLSTGALSFFGGALAYFARYRERLANSLQDTRSQFKNLSELYSAIIDHSPSGILSVGASDHKVQVMNRSALKIVGENLTGKPLFDTALKTIVLENNNRKEEAFSLYGDSKVLGYQSSELPNGDWLIVFQDLTEIRDLEEKFRLKERLASVGQLAAGIAHEIRNPLASLSGSVQLMKKDMPVDSSSEKLMRIVLRETDRLDALIRNFLVYAKPSELKIELVRIRKVVDEIVELVGHQRNHVGLIQFDIQISESLECQCDLRQLKQILWNLVLNAIDAMAKGGRLSIVGESTNVDSMPIVRIKVKDCGSGIPDTIKGRIFDPFFTTKAEGTGLGLALVYQMVKAHGGHLGVESEVGQGSEFWIDLLKDGPKDTERKVA